MAYDILALSAEYGSLIKQQEPSQASLISDHVREALGYARGWLDCAAGGRSDSDEPLSFAFMIGISYMTTGNRPLIADSWVRFQDKGKL